MVVKKAWQNYYAVVPSLWRNLGVLDKERQVKDEFLSSG